MNPSQDLHTAAMLPGATKDLSVEVCPQIGGWSGEAIVQKVELGIMSCQAEK